jgi:hypothetical protein
MWACVRFCEFCCSKVSPSCGRFGAISVAMAAKTRSLEREKAVWHGGRATDSDVLGSSRGRSLPHP